MTKLCLTVRCLSLLHFLQSSRVFKHLRGVNTFVLFLTCSQKANPCCVPLGEMLDSDDLDPARLRQRKSKSDYVELFSRSREADGVWGLFAMGKILLDPVNGKAVSEIDGQSDRDDMANGCFFEKSMCRLFLC